MDVEEESGGGRPGLSADFLREMLVDDAQRAYDKREAELGEEVARELERRVILTVLDRKWREHLYEMDYLRDGIGLRAMAQRDPLVEYQREGYDLFMAMMDAIKEEHDGAGFDDAGGDGTQAHGSDAPTGWSSVSTSGVSGCCCVTARQCGEYIAGGPSGQLSGGAFGSDDFQDCGGDPGDPCGGVGYVACGGRCRGADDA
jgi:hypothetical protein